MDHMLDLRKRAQRLLVECFSVMCLAQLILLQISTVLQPFIEWNAPKRFKIIWSQSNKILRTCQIRKKWPLCFLLCLNIICSNSSYWEMPMCLVQAEYPLLKAEATFLLHFIHLPPGNNFVRFWTQVSQKKLTKIQIRCASWCQRS